MKNKSVAVVVAAVAVAIIGIAAVLGVKMANTPDSPAIDVQPGYNEPYQQESSAYYPVYGETESTTDSWWGSIFQSEQISETDKSSSIAETSKLTVSPSTSLTQAVTEITEKATQLTTLINAKFSEVFDMPKAPKYIPPDTDIDFNTASIASYKYDPDGNYYYTDDKNAWQSNFGFNEGYDSMAPVTMMYYDTVRTKFTYDNKEWLVQLWKGQYGYAFVGGEVGVYTRKIGSSGTHFNCAKKEDWLKMEMLFMWDEYQTGDYRPVFQRPYTDYWWCTGFVVGFDGGVNRNQFRLMTHITFKDEEMANAFCEAFEANGFKRVASLDENNLDSFVQVGKDVGFVWQNIDQ